MRHRLAAVSAAALLCLGGTAGVARAEPAGPSGPSALVFTITQGNDAASGTVLRAAVLSCAYTAGGTHPAPRAACDAVNAAGGDFGRLLTAPAPGRACPKRYDPLTLTADGVWHGERLAWKHTFPNACMMSAALKDDPVFAF
ncbi:subtilisin inhibitor-like [Streptomyces sp. Ag109_G2-6]|uniref:subtilase-type protease inhibitor n=1 Tax=Streptomyces TaxID=1883 RepID=UPI0009A52061|nr:MULTISPECIES: subtilase-type protease inhibitor [Streptomyces]RPF43811.1 subtilisin inhibitor-like [Streptomyces sp. Ag109_G2-6]